MMERPDTLDDRAARAAQPRAGAARTTVRDSVGADSARPPVTSDDLVCRVRELMAAAAVPLKVPFVDLGATYRAQRDSIDEAIARVVDRSDFILGAAVRELEGSFAAYCDVEHAVGVDSGFSALELILRAYGIGDGDEVITAANTFVATVGAIDVVGARPVLVDVDPDSYTIDPDRVKAAITPATRAIIPVHLYGQPADADAINRIAAAHGLLVIEDACQAHGARYRGVRVGGLGDAAAFSFYPAKNLGAFGDGGMIVTDDPDVADRVRKLRNLGAATKYRHELKGFNRRLDTVHAAVLGVKLTRLDAANSSRRRTAALYTELLADLPVATPTAREDVEHVYHLYVVQTEERDRMRAHLQDAGIATGVHYPVPVHRQPAYRALGYRDGDFPVTERSADRIISLPIYPDMPLDAIAHTARSVRIFFSR
jgi:dTDP-4-amino-4,6-dideoxygalactose transaminase